MARIRDQSQDEGIGDAEGAVELTQVRIKDLVDAVLEMLFKLFRLGVASMKVDGKGDGKSGGYYQNSKQCQHKPEENLSLGGARASSFSYDNDNVSRDLCRFGLEEVKSMFLSELVSSSSLMISLLSTDVDILRSSVPLLFSQCGLYWVVYCVCWSATIGEKFLPTNAGIPEACQR
jgi:hypothetical protein